VDDRLYDTRSINMASLSFERIAVFGTISKKKLTAAFLSHISGVNV
jgi:hypothetical protein